MTLGLSEFGPFGSIKFEKSERAVSLNDLMRAGTTVRHYNSPRVLEGVPRGLTETGNNLFLL